VSLGLSESTRDNPIYRVPEIWHALAMTTVRVQLANPPDPTAKAAAGDALYAYNVAHTGIDDRQPIAAVAIDSTRGAVLGGLWGRTELGLLFLDMFFLPDNLRGQGIGTQLLEEVEREACRRGCRRAVVETSSFQAPAFYLRHGYQELGRVAFTLPGQARVFLRKEFTGLPDSG
jgi:GNAT superfamily N-acetyltransferase